MVDQFQKNIEYNKFIEGMKEEKRPWTAKLSEAKTSRAISMYEQTQQNWDSQAKKYSKKVMRPSSQGIFQQSKDHRIKIEEKKAVELAKPLEIKYGESAWLMKLRTMDKQAKITHFHPVGSQGIYLQVNDYLKPSIEVVRSPKQLTQYKDATLEFVRSQKQRELLSQLKKADRVSNLTVEGHNKLD